MTVTDLNKSKIIERPKLSSRTSSFSDVLAKFTSTRLNRRRGNNESLATFSSDTINLHSSIRTPSKIPRSSSFFGSLNAFKTKTATISSDEVDQAEQQSTGPGTPASQSSGNREGGSATKITRRGLMKPIGPPLPRSKTFAAMSNETSPLTPRFARATSSSLARQRRPVTREGSRTPTSISAGRRRQSSIRLIPQTPTPVSSTESQQHFYQLTARCTSIGNVIQPRERACQHSNETPTDDSNRRHSYFPTKNENKKLTYADTVQGLRTAFQNENHGTFPPAGSFRRDLRRYPSTASFEAAKNAEIKGTKEGDLTEEIMGQEKNTQEDILAPPVPRKSPKRVDDDESDDTSASQSPAPSPIPMNPRQISTLMPSTYWLGRLTSLSDRFRTEELPEPLAPLSPSPATTSPPISPSVFSTSFLNHGMHDDERRLRRVFIHLHSMCTTDAAKASLKEFKEKYEQRMVIEGQWERGERLLPAKTKGEEEKGKKGTFKKWMAARKSDL